MSKLYFSVQFPHENPLKPKFSIASNNLYGIDIQGADILHAKVGNGNLNKGYKNRFEYAVKTQKGATSVNLVVNTSIVLPHASWSPFPPKPAKEVVKEKKGGHDSDNDSKSRKSHARIRDSDRRKDDRAPARRERERRRSPSVSSSDDAYDDRAPVRYDDRRRNGSVHPASRRSYQDDEDDEHHRHRSSRHDDLRRGSRLSRRRGGQDRQWLAEDNNDVGMGSGDDGGDAD